MNQTQERVKNKLVLIKYLSEKKRTLEEISKFTAHKNISKLKKELGELFMIGVHPYTPADYIEIDFDGDFVELRLPLPFEKKIGLSTREWTKIIEALEKQISKDAESEKSELTSIKEKIKSVIPFAEFTLFENEKKKIITAIREKKQIKFQYESIKKETPENRKVDPWILFEEQSEYLAGYCHDKKGIRTFRLDRMNSVEVLNESASTFPTETQIKNHIDSFRKFLEKNKQSPEHAEILIHKSAYYNASKILETKIVSEKKIMDESYYLVRTIIMEKNWFIDTIKTFGEKIIVISPEEIKNEILDSLKQIKIISIVE